MRSLEEFKEKLYREKIQKALEITKVASDRAKEAGTPLIINFSGGKDSSCLMLLAQKVGADYEALYMSSGIELPNTVDFVKREANRLGVRLHISDPVRDYRGDLAYWVRRFGYFPYCDFAWCNSRLKVRPARAYFRKIFGNKPLYKLSGVRKAESDRRMRIYREKPYIRPDGEMAGSYLVEPIRDWSGKDVKRFLADNNFTVHKGYSQFGVSGCYWCPFYQVLIYEKILEVYPHIYDEIIALENEINQPSVSGRIFLRDIRDKGVSAVKQMPIEFPNVA